MSTRRTLLAGILLPAFVLFLLPAVASAQGAAAPPSGITLSTNGYGQILVSWASAGGSDIKGFRVRYEATDGNTFPGIADAFSDVVPAARRSVNISGLKHNTTYRFSVQARGATRDLDSDFITSVAEDTLIAPVPEQVDDVELVEDDGMLMVSWSEGDGNGIDIVGYEVQIKPDGGTYEPHYHEGIGTTTTIGGLMNGTKYFVQVRAINTDSENAGEYSDAVSGTPMADAGTTDDPMPEDADDADDADDAEPAAPTGKPAVEVMRGDGMATVSWTEVEGATKYRVEWRTAAQTFGNAARQKVVNPALMYVVPGLDNDMEYMFRVTAGNAAGFGPVSEEAKATPVAALPKPAPPTGTPAVEVTPGDGMATVSWTAVEGATKYMVEWRTAAQTFGNADRQATVNPHQEYEIEDLKNGTEYMFRVTAGNDAGYGPPSDEAKATPTARPYIGRADQPQGRGRRHDGHGYLARSEGGCGSD